MKGKMTSILIATMALLLALTPFANAQPNVDIFGYTDRTQYKPGDTGSVQFWAVNLAAIPATLKNITIEYPWFVPGTQLGGNYSIPITTTVTLNLNQNYTYTHQFTVPNNGRAQGGPINIRFGVDYYDTATPPVLHSRYFSGSVSLNVAATTFPFSLQDFSMLQTLLTINIIAIIIAALIVAAALFMTRHRSPTMA